MYPNEPPISDAPPNRGTISGSPPTDIYQLFLAVYHRGELSLGDHRKRLGFSAYHWAILVLDANHERYYAYDVTDGSTPDPVMRRDLNPDFQWTYRVKSNVHPESCDSLLIRMAIGKATDGIGPDTIKLLLQSVQLPIKGAHPPQNCVNWIRAVLHKLRFHGYARDLHNIEMTIDRALAYADLRMLDPDNAIAVLDHLGNELFYRPYVQ
ncbi:serine threonine protein kinase [Penicillium digitatum]|uniref:Uncharacterized protein n=3 Tax=Penicillium digitatum TaxID=36651 RepID=K9GYN0_PEND2|nr:hypothetical protein PDIP_12210 [Penicillium digitatum Pd1]EKV19748.1 hypothetical protein PDIG_00890 [Penicillium digitatum PHI26]EKV20849.1 hypothetical protein PDIP_12210 [Penicillium digitatum Pd1]KAG0156945.1 hypothetical protein PDIDSM_4128 [Penicillium digitatum]QQK44724.1 serine threonine protein kinase [Penicillium digitatum]